MTKPSEPNGTEPATADSGEPKLSASGFSRLISSGLLARARGALVGKLCERPADAAFWMRIGDICRSSGDLPEAAIHYARAAIATDNGGHETWALMKLLDGHPETAAALSDSRVQPFLIDQNPLSPELVKALLTIRQAAVGSGDARVGGGPEGSYDPEIRQATRWHIPVPIREEIQRCCASFAEQASGRLFPVAPEIPDIKMSLLDYRDGGGYRRHRDVGVPGSSLARRVLSVLLYLDVNEDSHAGGDLLLHDRSGNAMTRIRPRSGLAVAFRADTFHEVTRLTAKRNGGELRRTVLTLWCSSTSTP